MKKSEQLRIQSSKEDNDLIAMGILNKALREERSEKFEEVWLPKLLQCSSLESYEYSNHKYTFYFKDNNTVDFYPKANKLLLRKTNKWKKPGLRYLIEKFIK